VFRKDEALEICQELAKKHNLKATFLGAKKEEDSIIFFFSASEKENYRKFARELGKTLQSNIKLEEASPRQKAKKLGGIGKCGFSVCCASWLSKEDLDTIDSAENSLGGSMGPCGRPLCCLAFENLRAKREEETSTEKETAETKIKDEKESSKEEKEKKSKKKKRRVRKLKI